MSLILMKVEYESKNIPYLHPDFVEKLYDAFQVDRKNNHFYLDNEKDFDNEVKIYIENWDSKKLYGHSSTPKEIMVEIKKFLDDVMEFKKYVKKQDNDWGIEFCVG